MSSRSLTRSIVFATLAATPLATAPNAAHAQGLIDFLWGGTDEWGGKRQVVDFDQKYTADQIIVSFGDRRLYLITQKGKAISYPIAVPREQSRWQGTTIVSEKKLNPSWRPTPDMLKENPKLPTWVPGGHPMNPLGVRAMYLGASTYRIHGTDAPWTIGQAVSKGCIRMYNEDVLDLYPRVPVGMKVTVTWQQFNSQAIAANDDSAPPFAYDPAPAPPGTSSKASRTIRNLPPPPSSLTTDNVGAANKMAPPDPSTGDKQGKPIAKLKAPKAKKPETVAATTTSSSAAPASTAAATPAPPALAKGASAAPAATSIAPAPKTSNAVEAATKAAAAATRAAESARAAAEAAKKAAADAKKATSADGDKEPGKEDAAKRAAL